MIWALLIAAGFFGMMTLIVSIGFQSMEQERRDRAAQSGLYAPGFQSGFFAEERGGVSAADADLAEVGQMALDELVEELEDYLRQEKQQARRFVEAPSFGVLHERKRS